MFFFGGEDGKEFLPEYSHDDNHSFIINSFCVTVNVLVLNIVILHSHFTNTQTHTHRPAHTLFTIYWSKTTEISIVCRSFFFYLSSFFFVFGYIVLWELRWIWNLNFFFFISPCLSWLYSVFFTLHIYLCQFFFYLVVRKSLFEFTKKNADNMMMIMMI